MLRQNRNSKDARADSNVIKSKWFKVCKPCAKIILFYLGTSSCNKNYRIIQCHIFSPKTKTNCCKPA